MELTKTDVISALRTCRDPEIPVNIFDLGLVYDIVLNPSAEETTDITVKMTLTSPGCPMANSISHEVQHKLQTLAGVGRAQVDLVWEPVWQPDMITPDGRRQLNLA